MRFDSKSLLSTIPMGPLEFECRNLAEIFLANGQLPNLPVTYLGGGCFGSAYALDNFPGLVLKLCTRDDDAYPVFIRHIASMEKPPAWAPRVFAYGGDERDGGVFWCVLPKYEAINSDGEEAEVHWMQYSRMISRASYDNGCMWHWRRYVQRDYHSMRKVLAGLSDLLGYSEGEGTYDTDNHRGNSMWDPARQRLVFTDPFGCTEPNRKSSMPYYANL